MLVAVEVVLEQHPHPFMLVVQELQEFLVVTAET
jgi:hypothetical protein